MFSFHHVGYVVADLDASVEGFKKLGYCASKLYDDVDQDIEIIIMKDNNDMLIELIYPKDRGHPLNRFLGKNIAASPYHVAYLVQNINTAGSYLRSNGFVETMKVAPSVAFEGKPFVFYYSQTTGLIELIENC